MRLLRSHASDDPRGDAAGSTRIVELGPGNGRKLATLLASAAPRQHAHDVHLIDVSPRRSRGRADALDGSTTCTSIAHEASYEAGLETSRHACAMAPDAR